jgi:molecular chaperone DnaJ
VDRDLYELLGVPRTASADDLKKAHRGMVRKYHPDVNKEPGAEARFKEIQDAYDVLADPEKRKLYDQFGMAGVRAGPAGGAPGGGAGAGPFGGGQGWQNVDPSTFEEVFGSMFGGGRGGRARAGRGGFGGFGGFGGDEEDGPRQGRNLDVEETVDFTTAALGGTRSFRVRGESIDVRIPAGIADGAKLAVRGKGAPGEHGGPAGDLIVTVRVSPHPWLRREGDDLVTDLPVSIAEATLGATVRVPLLEGSVQLKVPAGVRSGQRLRVKGKGICPAKGTPGDFLASVLVEAPRSVDAEARRLVEELAPRLPNPRTGPQWS